MSFFGKAYTLERQENFEEFLKSLGSEVSPQMIAALVNHKPTVKIVKNGDSYTFSSSNPDNSTTELNFKDGVEFEETSRGLPAKTTFTINGNTVTQEQKFAKNGVSITSKREFNDNELVMTITSSVWDGVARRFYKA